jgi:ribosomal protein L37AE/L43A
MQEEPDQVGRQVYCPRCKAVAVVPAETDPNVRPLQIQVTKVSKSTYQLVCPCCEGTTNFRESTLGGITKCRNCGFKIKHPTSIPSSSSRGCMVLVLLLSAGLLSFILAA